MAHLATVVGDRQINRFLCTSIPTNNLLDSRSMICLLLVVDALARKVWLGVARHAIRDAAEADRPQIPRSRSV